MNRFDGILICSDIDGTLAFRRDVPAKNLDAIAYFQSRGGRFTVATGRNFRYLHRLPAVKINAPIITENGARIFDPELGRTLWEFPLDSSEILLEWIDAQQVPKVCLGFTDEYVEGVSGSVLEAVLSHKTGELLQVICGWFATEEETMAFRDKARKTFGMRYEICRSWSHGVEFISPLGGKGNSLRCLKTILAPQVKMVIAVGDFENDAPLLRCADRGFAPANACPETLGEAEAVLCRFEEGAVADLIERLDREYEGGLL